MKKLLLNREMESIRQRPLFPRTHTNTPEAEQ